MGLPIAMHICTFLCLSFLAVFPYLHTVFSPFLKPPWISTIVCMCTHNSVIYIKLALELDTCKEMFMVNLINAIYGLYRDHLYLRVNNWWRWTWIVQSGMKCQDGMCRCARASARQNCPHSQRKKCARHAYRRPHALSAVFTVARGIGCLCYSLIGRISTGMSTW